MLFSPTRGPLFGPFSEVSFLFGGFVITIGKVAASLEPTGGGVVPFVLLRLVGVVGEVMVVPVIFVKLLLFVVFVVFGAFVTSVKGFEVLVVVFLSIFTKKEENHGYIDAESLIYMCDGWCSLGCIVF